MRAIYFQYLKKRSEDNQTEKLETDVLCIDDEEAIALKKNLQKAKKVQKSNKCWVFYVWDQKMMLQSERIFIELS